MTETTDTIRPDLADALKDALDTLSGGGPDGFGSHFTCSEAESIARLFRAAGRDDDAASWLRDHGTGDDEGDDHFQPEDVDEDRRDVPGCRKVECLVCGTVRTDPFSIDLWNNYGDCPSTVEHPEEQRSRWTFDRFSMEVRTDDMGNTEHAAFTFDHDARPDDDTEPGDRCKDCGRPVTWVGPSQADWRHTESEDAA